MIIKMFTTGIEKDERSDEDAAEDELAVKDQNLKVKKLNDSSKKGSKNE